MVGDKFPATQNLHNKLVVKILIMATKEAGRGMKQKWNSKNRHTYITEFSLRYMWHFKSPLNGWIVQ